MRILQINKFLYPRAGSETVLLATRQLLSEHGHQVLDFAMQDPRNIPSAFSGFFAPPREYLDSDRPTVHRAKDALASIYSFEVRKRLRALLQEHQVDVAHLHLIYHQLTCSVIDALVDEGIPIVMTAHDLKVACPKYTLFRDGHPCRLCVTGNPWHAVEHRCIKGSIPASFVAAFEAQLARARRTYQKVDAWITPSAFAASVLSQAGIKRSRIHVVPNFLSATELEGPRKPDHTEKRFLFAGRLESPKGLQDLLKIYAQSSGELGVLAVAGAGGDLLEDVKEAASQSQHIEYMGRISRSDISRELLRSRAALLPARWEENYPMSVLEAQATSTAVVCSDRGGLPEQVHDGVHGIVVPAGNVPALRAALHRLADDEALARRLGAAGHERLLAENGPLQHHDRLMQIYDEARGSARRGRL